MYTFTMPPHQYFSSQDVPLFYHEGYVRFQERGRTAYINFLKMEERFQDAILIASKDHLREILRIDLPLVLARSGVARLTFVCVPRAKHEGFYDVAQQSLRTTVAEVVRTLPGYEDGTNWIKRVVDTKTTHRHQNMFYLGKPNEGKMPYAGISRDTCTFDPRIAGRDLVLFDDIYTRGVGIDEDLVQTLLDLGARSVRMYCLARAGQRPDHIVKCA